MSKTHRFRLKVLEAVLLRRGLKTLMAREARIRRHHGPVLVLALGQVVGRLDRRRLEADGVVERLTKARVRRRRDGPGGRVGISE